MNKCFERKIKKIEKKIVDENEGVGEEESKNIEEEEKAVKKIDIARDAVGAKHIKIEQSVYFLENALFVVEVPV